MTNKQRLQKFIIPAFYIAALALVVFYAMNEQTGIRLGGNSPLYRNLMEESAFIRRGFDPKELKTIPDTSDSVGVICNWA